VPDFRQQLETSLGTSYSVERELGGGGMSRVFLAEETQLGRKVVIKLLAPESAEGLSVERFEREIRLAAGLQEPHIVPVIAAGVAAGLPFYTMPFIAGESLRARLSLGEVPLREGLAILTDVATALEYAHERGIVHRDIKPENILLSKRSAVVTDFGIAKAIADSRKRGDFTLTAVGTSLGTPPYMAPEQIAADPAIDQRADLYALGVLAYEIFTGSTPFAGRTPTQLVAAIMSEEPEPLSVRRPDLPPSLTALVRRLLAKDRLARPQSAAEVLHTLDDLAITGEQRHSSGALGKRRLVAGVFAAALLVVGAAYVMRSRTDAQSLNAQDDAFWKGGRDRSVAVLPFTTMSGDTADEHFAEGLTDELISALSKVQGLTVIGGRSTFRLRDKDPKVIAESLKVATLVEGSYRRADGRIRANIRLVRPKDGTTLWTGDFDRQGSDLFAVQEEIAGAVVDSLHVQREGTTRGPIVGEPTRDLVAYDLYLAGRQLAVTRKREALDSAKSLFLSATRRDPKFALAFSALADAYTVSISLNFGPRQQNLDLGENAADRAIELDPRLGEGLSSKGFVLMNRRRQLGAAEASFQRAISLDPSYFWAHHYYSMLLTMERRLDDAERENRRALKIDPLSAQANLHRGTLLVMRGNNPAARLALHSALAINPGFPIPLYQLGIIDAADGRYKEALVSLGQAYEKAPDFSGLRSALAYTYTRLGQAAKANEMLNELRAKGDGDPARIERALGEAVMGNIDGAFEGLRTVSSESWDFSSTINLRESPLLSKFRQDRRYAALLGTMGLKP
jgi:serine/threonine protein kinase/tetratricopeptide (TPR) repeat protein